MFVVRAVAAGVTQANPFFEEDGTLGKDTTGTPRARPIGGVQASNSPGLYGGTPAGESGGEPGGHSGTPGQGGNHGTPGPGESGAPTPDFGGSTRPGTCVVGKLKQFLTDPKNSARAREWARVLNIRPDEIPGYIDRLTPVVLRHDTLVTNHAYEHGKAVPFDALLQAGIAVLVDDQGLPAVKCSCGNPLRPSRVDIEKSSVGFEGGNRKWSGYRQDRIVLVEPPPGKAPIERLRLVDVDNPDRGITRPLGTEGEHDTSFDPHAGTAVPQVTGLTFAEASGRLADVGLALSHEGGSLPPDDARVTSSRPVAGSALEWGSQVTLSVSDPGGGGDAGTPPDTGGLTPGPDQSSTGGSTGETGSGAATGETGTGTGPGETGTGQTSAGETGTGATAGETGPSPATTGETTTGAATGATTTGPTSIGGTTGETTTGAATGETTTGHTTSGAATGSATTGAATAGQTTTGATSGAGTTGQTTTGATTTGLTTTGATTAGAGTGRSSAGQTGDGATTGSGGSGSDSGATGPTTTGATGETTTGTGDTASGGTGPADSGGVGDSVGPSSSPGGTT
ncbi:DUF6777 domain-containing protein [Streptomyces sp. NPDC091209]|uniref:DUF6777 domain-containing protein n=1 Tax=Streptomyces sp. NPDC091209 TaxID=3365974 RepID=UPI003804D408